MTLDLFAPADGVHPVSRKECEDYVLNVHYAKRWPSVSYAFGLYEDGELVGVVTYGNPPSSPLRKGIAGEEYEKDVIELNRLVLRDNKKNQASYLVAASLRMLDGNRIIVSFADTEQGHAGYVYQATNFIYTGLSAKRTSWTIKGKEGAHAYSVADEFRGQPNRAQAMRDKYGDDFYLKERSRKHRYIYIIGTKRYKKSVKRALIYPVSEYPKN